MPTHGRFTTYTAWCDLADKRDWDAFTAREVAYGHVASLMAKLGPGVHRVHVEAGGSSWTYEATVTLRPEITGVREVD